MKKLVNIVVSLFMIFAPENCLQLAPINKFCSMHQFKNDVEQSMLKAFQMFNL